MKLLATLCNASVIAASFLASSGKLVAQDMLKPKAKRADALTKVRLMEYLNSMSVKLDCYVTVEDYRSSTSNDLFQLDGSNVNDIPSLVRQLNSLPNVKAEISPDVSCIIHVRQGNLDNSTGDTLNNKVSIEFNGRLFNLVSSLGDIPNNHLGNRSVYSANDMAVSDAITKVNFSSSDKPIRDVLSDFLPLSDYNRVLWRSMMSLNTSNPITEVIYSWPCMNEKTRLVSHLDFSQGEPAFRNNLNSAQNVANAIDFITNRMRQNETRQVRWAMLFLGKCRSERAAPLLLKYVDYQFTTSPLIEERYPALKALHEIGPVASNQALQLLREETDDRRLELLCRVILSVMGREKGRLSIANVAAALPNNAQRSNISVALNKALAPGATATVAASRQS